MTAVVEYMDSLPDRLRMQAATIYFDAFEQKLDPILGRRIGIGLLGRTLNPDRAIVAVCGGELAGLAGLKYGGRAFMALGVRDMLRTYGVMRGLWKSTLLALLDRSERRGELLMDGIAVHRDMRGRGIGTALLKRVIAVACERGCQTVRLDVVDTNPAARRLYRREGFVATETVQVPFLRRLMGFSASTTMIKTVAT